MKKVIDGLVYDTKTAEELAHDWNSYARNDFHFCEEWLYKTKKGAYFLHGEGGALTSYSVAVGNASSGSEDIRPLSKQDALEWCEGHNLTDVIELEFDDMIETA